MVAPRSNFMLCWENQIRVGLTTTGILSDYPIANVLTDDPAEIFRRNHFAGTDVQIDFLLGPALIGTDKGPPESNAPTTTVTAVAVAPNDDYVFLCGGGYVGGFAAFPFNRKRGTFGAKLADRSGSTLSAANRVACVLYNGTLFVAISGTRSAGGAGFEVYTLDAQTGEWGARLSDGGSATAQDGTCIAMHASAGATTATIVCGHGSSPFASRHTLNMASLSIGSKASDPGDAISGAVNAVALTEFNAGTVVCVLALGTTPFLNAYPGTTTWGTRFTNPTALAGIGRSIAVTRHESSGTRYVAVGHDTTPFFSVLPISATAFSTKLANPASLPSASGNAVAWHPGSEYLAVAHNTGSPDLFVYAFSWSPAIGTRYTDFYPSVTASRAAVWSRDGRWLLCGNGGSTYLRVRASEEGPTTGAVDVLLVTAMNYEAASTFRLRLDNDSAFGSPSYDSGGSPQLAMFPAGTTAEILRRYPAQLVHVLAAQVSEQYARLDLTNLRATGFESMRSYDDIGIVRLFKCWQSEVNVVSWSPLTEPLSIRSPRGLGNVRVEPRRTRRGIRATYGWLEDSEIRALHHLLMQIPQVPVLAIGFPEDGDHNFQTAVWGLMEVDDPEYDPEFELWSIKIRVWEQV